MAFTISFFDNYTDPKDAIGGTWIGKVTLDAPNAKPQWVKTSVPCPMCHDTLHHLVNGKNRVCEEPKLNKHGVYEGHVTLIPATHRVLSCHKCRVFFYAPKEQP